MYNSRSRNSHSLSHKDTSRSIHSGRRCKAFSQHPSGELFSSFVRALCTSVLEYDSITLFLGKVVVAPILLGSYLQNVFPSLVKLVIPFAPLAAVLTSSLLASRFLCLSIIVV